MSRNLSLTEQVINLRPFPKAYGFWPDKIAKWIDDSVPCLLPGRMQAADDTDLVIRHLRWRGVSDSMIAAGLAKSNNTFDLTHHFHLSILAYRPKMPQQPNSMSPVVPMDREQLRLKAAELDARFEVAENANNLPEMKRIAELLLALLGNTSRMIREKERLDGVRAEILRNSPNIARHVRPFGPPEPPVPGPDGRVPQFRLQMLPPRVRTGRVRR